MAYHASEAESFLDIVGCLLKRAITVTSPPEQTTSRLR